MMYVVADRLPALLAALALLGAVGCGTSPDAATSGSICTPPRSDCPAERTILRSETGSNLLDVRIVNQGPAGTITLDIDAQTEDAALSPDAAPAPSSESIFPVSYELQPGESATDRFGPSELFTRRRLQLSLACQSTDDSPCDAIVEYVYMTQPSECDNDDDCSRGQICRTSTATCVDCLDDGDCEGDRTCHNSTGRCLPPPESGCTHSPGRPLPLAPLLFLLVFLGIRIRLDRQRIFALASFTLASSLLLPSPAAARAPDSTLSLSAGPRYVTGELGESAERGLGVELHEALRWRHLGADFWIETNYFLTTQQPPPLNHELQIFGFGLGPRAYIPVGPLEIALGAGYQRVGLGPNALVRQTGSDANFHAVGGTFGLGYLFSPFVARADLQYQHLIGADGGLLSINLSFGVTTR